MILKNKHDIPSPLCVFRQQRQRCLVDWNATRVVSAVDRHEEHFERFINGIRQTRQTIDGQTQIPMGQIDIRAVFDVVDVFDAAQLRSGVRKRENTHKQYQKYQYNGCPTVRLDVTANHREYISKSPTQPAERRRLCSKFELNATKTRINIH